MVPHSYKKQRQFVQHLLGGGGILVLFMVRGRAIF